MRYATLTLVTTIAVSITTIGLAWVDAAGRYKKEGQRCVWDPNDTGPNQCTPPSGRYKVGTWDQGRGAGPVHTAEGALQEGWRPCVWDANDSGTDQWRPTAAPR